MARGFLSVIWSWDIDRADKPLRAVYDLGYSLEPLALSQQEQYDSIPDC
jgi:hypothetical protein